MANFSPDSGAEILLPLHEEFQPGLKCKAGSLDAKYEIVCEKISGESKCKEIRIVRLGQLPLS